MRDFVSVLVFVAAIVFLTLTPKDKSSWNECRQDHSALHCLKKFAE